MSNTHIKWTPQLVACHFEEAALTTKLLPPVRVQGYFKSLPDVIRTPLELALIELEWAKEKKKKNPKSQPEPDPERIRATSAAISRWTQTFDWIPWLEDERDRKIIWWRAAGNSCGVIGRKLGCHKSTISRQWHDALAAISSCLNKRGILPSEAIIERGKYENHMDN